MTGDSLVGFIVLAFKSGVCDDTFSLQTLSVLHIKFKAVLQKEKVKKKNEEKEEGDEEEEL